ncbi:hypothetical protein [Legionella hackeliae]|uniref:hypothetical protein n=1 Tax=Legionella hackeliae TaxID=449 RepID=UPI0012E399DB|nr:hypothetical protein [Legionella hackeliae]
MPKWGFSSFLSKQPPSYFEAFVRHHPILNLEYSVFCTKLANNILNRTKHESLTQLTNDEELIEQITAALVISELLAHLHRHYLAVPREVTSLEAEQTIYRNWLKNRRFQFEDKKESTIVPPGFFTQTVRDRTVWLNWPRLFSNRIRRVFTTAILIPVVKDMKYFYQFVIFADRFANPTLTYFSWLFYIPRLTVNVALLFKHLIPGGWMDDKEKKLSFLTRLQGQLQRRWFELGNDTIWLTGGLLNCFVLTGALSPIGMYLTISFFLFDAVWAGLRAFIELGRLRELERYYERKGVELNINSASEAELKELKEYQETLQQRIDFEWQRLIISVASTSTLFLAMCLALPLITNPVITFISALLVITITLVTYIKSQELEKRRPVNPMMKLAEREYADLLTDQGLFKPNNQESPTASSQMGHNSTSQPISRTEYS